MINTYPNSEQDTEADWTHGFSESENSAVYGVEIGFINYNLNSQPIIVVSDSKTFKLGDQALLSNNYYNTSCDQASYVRDFKSTLYVYWFCYSTDAKCDSTTSLGWITQLAPTSVPPTIVPPTNEPLTDAPTTLSPSAISVENSNTNTCNTWACTFGGVLVISLIVIAAFVGFGYLTYSYGKQSVLNRERLIEVSEFDN